MEVRVRTVKGVVALLGVAAFGAAIGVAVPEVRPPRPPIVIYLVDTLRPDHLKLYGYERETAPELTRFARDATVFDNAYAPTPWTRPSSASLLTGQDPPAHGVRAPRHKLGPGSLLLSERLRPLGYHAVGVVANPHVLPFWGFDRGYDAYYDVGASGSQWRHSGANEVIRKLFEHIDGQPKGPFFYYVHTIDPHGPYTPIPPYDELFTDDPQPIGLMKLRALKPGASDAELFNLNAMYDAEVYFSDLHFGRLLARLRERGEYERALIAFVSDHGEEHLEHGLVGHGQQLFDESLRVPMVLKLPGKVGAGRRVAEPVALADIVPTVLELIGEDIPANFSGRSLLGLITAAGIPEGKRAPPRALHFELDMKQVQLVAPAPGAEQLMLVGPRGSRRVARGVLFGGWKYIREVVPERRDWLFDLDADPGESKNRFEAAHPGARELAAVMDAYLSSYAAGAHLHFAGGGPDTVTVVSGQLRTEGGFQEVRALEVEPEDGIELGEGGKALNVRFTLRGFRYGLGGSKRWFQDVDGVAFVVEPPGAPVVFESLDAVGQDGLVPLFMGAERRRSPALPQRLELGDPALVVGDAARLFGGEARRHGRIVAGGYFFVVPPPAATDAQGDVPDAIQERLRALGYVD